jgi:hypothetical protein
MTGKEDFYFTSCFVTYGVVLKARFRINSGITSRGIHLLSLTAPLIPDPSSFGVEGKKGYIPFRLRRDCHIEKHSRKQIQYKKPPHLLFLLALRASVSGLTDSPCVLYGAHYSSHQHSQEERKIQMEYRRSKDGMGRVLLSSDHLVILNLFQDL